MDRIKIGEVTEENLAEIIRLAELVWWDHFPDIITDCQIEYMLYKGYTEDKIISEIDSGTVYWITLLKNDEIIGFASYGPTENIGEMQLHKLYIHPCFQRSGFGTVLLQHIQKEAVDNGCNYLILAVNKNNKEAISAYSRNGFIIRESRITDIGSGFFMDDYIMGKPLAYLIS